MIDNIVSWLTKHSPLLYLTQSFWRDEAFAWEIARQSPIDIVFNAINDFNPPLHYLILHYWMKLFGQGELSQRLLSFLFFLLLILVVYQFSGYLLKDRWRIVFPLFIALNPMLIHYAFEVRMYSMFAFFSTLSTFAFFRKRWILYSLSSILGLYTHSYMPFTLLVHLVYVVLTFLKKRIKRLNKSMIAEMPAFACPEYLYALVAIFIFYLPWLPVIFYQWLRSGESWIYPIDLQLVTSSLGNLFTGYEGTPGGWWWATRLLSVVIVVFSLFALKERFWSSLFFILWYGLPLTIVLAVSVVKPIYVNRYLLFATVAEVMVVGLAIVSIKKKWLRWLVALFVILILLTVNITFPLPKKKLDTRRVYKELSQKAPIDAIILTDPLVYFDGLYYFVDSSRVFIYNPWGGDIQSYVGKAVIPETKIVKEIPRGVQVYQVHGDGLVREVAK